MDKSGNVGILVAFGGALFAVIILLSISADITSDVQADVACASGYTYVLNATYPGGLCCLAANASSGTCAATNDQEFTISGNTTRNGQEGLLQLANQTPNMGTLIGVIALLSVVLMVAAIVMRRAR